MRTANVDRKSRDCSANTGSGGSPSGTDDLAHAALLIDESLGTDVVAAKIDCDVWLAAFRAGTRRRIGKHHRRIDAGRACRASDTKIGSVVHVFTQQPPRAAVLTAGFVDPKLLLHASVGKVVDCVLVADPLVGG